MNSAILKLASQYLKWIMIIFSVFILLRGHNYPGGGFIGGILAGSGLLFDAMANKVAILHKKLPVKPFSLIAAGLLACVAAAVPGIITGEGILTAYQTKINFPVLKEITPGTPLLFDTGIYLLVTGSFLLIIFSIMEELQWK